jgi:hypothetical protein
MREAPIMWHSLPKLCLGERRAEPAEIPAAHLRPGAIFDSGYVTARTRSRNEMYVGRRYKVYCL